MRVIMELSIDELLRAKAGRILHAAIRSLPEMWRRKAGYIVEKKDMMVLTRFLIFSVFSSLKTNKL